MSNYNIDSENRFLPSKHDLNIHKEHINKNNEYGFQKSPLTLGDALFPRIEKSLNDYSEQPDFIGIPAEVQLPNGMTKEDLQGAIDEAKRITGDKGQVLAFVREKLEYNGHEIGGRSYVLDEKSIIEVSIAAAESAASSPTLVPDVAVPGSADQQLWAIMFEEALHNARKRTGLTDGREYFNHLDLESPTSEDHKQYANQPEELAIEEALNGGILQAKFGPTARYISQRVVHLRISTDALKNVRFDSNLNQSKIILPISLNNYNLLIKPETNLPNKQIKTTSLTQIFPLLKPNNTEKNIQT